MINREHTLSLTRQAQLLELSRGSLYYTPVGASDADLRLMKRIDELHLGLPFAGSRMLRDLLRARRRCSTRSTSPRAGSAAS